MRRGEDEKRGELEEGEMFKREKKEGRWGGGGGGLQMEKKTAQTNCQLKYAKK